MKYLDRFVGRERELEEVSTLLDDARLLTLLGPPGVGKSRIVAELLDKKLEGSKSHVVDLHDTRDEQRALSKIAVASGLSTPLAPGSEKAINTIGRRLVATDVRLLVLDGCDALTEGLRSPVASWLTTSGLLSVLATSRSRLGVAGEHTYDITPLDCGGDEETGPGAAIQLFEARAREVDAAHDSLTARDAVAQLCIALDGLPLAIEIAAARLRVMTPKQLLDRIGALDGGGLERAVTWSWEQLGPDERSAFAQCSVFEGGFGLDAAEAVIALRTAKLLDVLHELRNRSLLQLDAAAVEPRFRLLRGFRSFAQQRLAETPELQSAAASAHAVFYTACAKRWNDDFDTERDTEARLQLSLDTDNLMVAQRRSGAFALATALGRFYSDRGPLTTGIRVLDDALEHADDEPEAAQALCVRSHLMQLAGDLDRSLADARRAQQIAERCDDPGTLVVGANREGWALLGAGETDAAVTAFDRALQRGGASMRPVDEASAWSGVAMARPDRDEAVELLRSAVHSLRSAGLSTKAAFALTNLAWAEHTRGHLDRADAAAREALSAAGAGSEMATGVGALILALVADEREDEREAERSFATAARCHEQLGNRYYAALTAAYQGDFLRRRGEHERARERLAFALTTFEALDDPRYLAIVNAYRALLALASDDRALAHHALDDALDFASRTRSPGFVMAIDLYRARVGLGAAGDDEQLELQQAARRLLQAATTADGGEAPAKRSSYVRLAASELERWLGSEREPKRVLRVSSDAESFALESLEEVSLRTRGAIRRVFGALANNRRDAPGTPLDVHRLFEAGWPGQTVDPESGAARVYTAIKTLRQMGLRDVLVRTDEGYLLDPDIPMAPLISRND